jgi:peptide-methionine (S)-S-oxide reductase
MPGADDKAQVEVATLAGGCFWCIEAVYKEVEGVIDAVPGYSGGATANPSYEQVSTGKTGHAESVQVTFDSSRISYREILEIFFSVHDPTTLNRQGADIGTQYRSAIFYHDEQQKKAADEIVREMARDKMFNHAIVTQIVPLDRFYPAEDYHRDYFQKHPEQAYCQVVIAPKLAKFRQHWEAKLRK